MLVAVPCGGLTLFQREIAGYDAGGFKKRTAGAAELGADFQFYGGTGEGGDDADYTG